MLISGTPEESYDPATDEDMREMMKPLTTITFGLFTKGEISYFILYHPFYLIMELSVNCKLMIVSTMSKCVLLHPIMFINVSNLLELANLHVKKFSSVKRPKQR